MSPQHTTRAPSLCASPMATSDTTTCIINHEAMRTVASARTFGCVATLSALGEMIRLVRELRDRCVRRGEIRKARTQTEMLYRHGAESEVPVPSQLGGADGRQ